MRANDHLAGSLLAQDSLDLHRSNVPHAVLFAQRLRLFTSVSVRKEWPWTRVLVTGQPASARRQPARLLLAPISGHVTG
jgi:hypothetical protein